MAPTLNVKERIVAVRAHVSNFTNDQIVLVLQHHDYDVHKTISDCLEGRAQDILNEWTHLGPIKTGKTKKKKASKRRQDKSKDAQPPASVEPTVNGVADGASENNPILPDKASSQASLPVNTVNSSQMSTAETLKRMLTNEVEDDRAKKPVANDHSELPPPPSNQNDKVLPCNDNVDAPPVNPIELQKTLKSHLLHSGRQSRTTSESSAKAKANRKKHKAASNLTNPNHDDTTNSQSNQVPTHLSASSIANKKSIEKASRDLQRCSVSFGRYRNLLNDEINDSYKRIKQTFEKANNAIMDREVKLMRQLDDLKLHASDLLDKREKKAKELKKQTERVGGMSQHELHELRNDIKHFVAERKFDEELGRTTRFVFDKEFLDKISDFGEISAVKNSYTNKPPRERFESYRSTASDVSCYSTPSVSEVAPPSEPVISPLAQEPKPVERPPASETTPDVPPAASPDWADSVDSHPLLESRASWASDIPLASSQPHQGGPKGEENQAKDFYPKPRRQGPYKRNKPKDNRQQHASSDASDKDKTTMPPPQKIPPHRNNRSPKFNKGGFSPRPQRDVRVVKVDDGHGDRGYPPGGRVEDSTGFGDGYRGSPKPRYRGGGRGGYRGTYRNGPNDRYSKPHYANGDPSQDSRPRESGPNDGPLPQRNRPRNHPREPPSSQQPQKLYKSRSDDSYKSNRQGQNHVTYNSETSHAKPEPQNIPDKQRKNTSSSSAAKLE